MRWRAHGTLTTHTPLPFATAPAPPIFLHGCMRTAAESTCWLLTPAARFVLVRPSVPASPHPPPAGRTLEAALGEVVQEDELAAIRARQQEYSALRSAELAEVQRLEAEVSRKAGERARRLAQERSRAAREAEVQRKVAAAAFARSFVGAMRGNALGHLRDCGYFYSPLRREVETGVLPGIYKALAALTASREGVAAALAEEVVAEALQRASAQYGTYVARMRAEREAAAAEAQRQAEEAAAAAVKAAADAAAAAAAAAEGGAGEEGGAEGGEGEEAAE